MDTPDSDEIEKEKEFSDSLRKKGFEGGEPIHEFPCNFSKEDAQKSLFGLDLLERLACSAAQRRQLRQAAGRTDESRAALRRLRSLHRRLTGRLLRGARLVHGGLGPQVGIRLVQQGDQASAIRQQQLQ